jgi:hypothetical protein
MKRTFADVAATIDQLSGRPLTFLVALLTIAVWAITGPLFHFSDTWQLVINTYQRHHVSYGLHHPEYPKPGWRGYSGKT